MSTVWLRCISVGVVILFFIAHVLRPARAGGGKAHDDQGRGASHHVLGASQGHELRPSHALPRLLGEERARPATAYPTSGAAAATDGRHVYHSAVKWLLGTGEATSTIWSSRRMSSTVFGAICSAASEFFAVCAVPVVAAHGWDLHKGAAPNFDPDLPRCYGGGGARRVRVALPCDKIACETRRTRLRAPFSPPAKRDEASSQQLKSQGPKHARRLRPH